MSLSASIPAALQELAKNHNLANDIVGYVQDEYHVKGNRDGGFDLTKNYTRDALLAVADHVCSVSTQLSQFVSDQVSTMFYSPKCITYFITNSH